MKNLINWLFTIPFLLLFSLTLVCFDLVLRLLPTKQMAELTSYWTCWTVLKIFAVCGVSFKLETYPDFKQNLQSDSAKVIVANHQSLIDLAILVVMFKDLRPRFISKKELAKNLPYVSLQLRKGGHCVIDRNDRKQALEAIKAKARSLSLENHALIIFPEGTRARDGKVKKFKPGGLAAIFAELGEVQVYPVAINNSYLLAKHKMMPVPFGVKVSAKALPYVNVNARDDLKEKVQEIEQLITREIAYEL